MKFRPFTMPASAALVLAASILFVAGADAVNIRATRVDKSNRDKVRRIVHTFTASSVDTLLIGFPAEIVSAQAATAEVDITPLGDPDCKIVDSYFGDSSRSIANPRAGQPCFDWGVETVLAGDPPHDMGYGSIVAVIVAGAGSGGTVTLICTSRGPR